MNLFVFFKNSTQWDSNNLIISGLNKNIFLNIIGSHEQRIANRNLGSVTGAAHVAPEEADSYLVKCSSPSPQEM